MNATFARAQEQKMVMLYQDMSSFTQSQTHSGTYRVKSRVMEIVEPHVSFA